jgi:hypothetical protein
MRPPTTRLTQGNGPGPHEAGLPISYMMNKMGAGIVGSERATEYGRAVYDAMAKLA